MAEFNIAALANKPEYDWASIALKSLDDLTVEYVSDLEKASPDFDPLQFESLLSDVAMHLDNCLAYRKEIYNLQASAVRSALDFELYARQSQALRALELSEGILTEKATERDATAIAVEAFDRDSAAPLSKGFKAVAATSLAVTDAELATYNARITAIREKWSLQDQYQAALRARHSEPGNAFNYNQRIERALALYREEIRDAYEKARAANAGAILIHGLERDLYQLPPLGSDFLDHFVTWNRKIARELNKRARSDIEFELIFPLVGQISTEPLVTQAAYAEAMANGKPGELIFDLSKRFPDALNYLRLRAVGMSFGLDDMSADNYGKMRYRRLTALVMLPSVKDPFSVHGALVERHPVVLGNIGFTDPSQPVDYARGQNINNVDPRGEWRIKVATFARTHETHTIFRDSSFSDLKLHLLLAAQPSKAIADWRGVNF